MPELFANRFWQKRLCGSNLRHTYFTEFLWCLIKNYHEVMWTLIHSENRHDNQYILGKQLWNVHIHTTKYTHNLNEVVVIRLLVYMLRHLLTLWGLHIDEGIQEKRGHLSPFYNTGVANKTTDVLWYGRRKKMLLNQFFEIFCTVPALDDVPVFYHFFFKEIPFVFILRTFAFIICHLPFIFN